MSTRFARIAPALFAGLMAFALTHHAAADIFQWEWIDPGDPGQGIRQSTTVCPGGAGVSAQPWANLWDRDLTRAYLTGADLTGAFFANWQGGSATLTNADFTDAQVAYASFGSYAGPCKGFTAAQLYSTASYKAKDLHGIVLVYNNLTGWNFASQNLTGANCDLATLTNADFTNAQVAQASFRDTTRSGFTAAQLYSTASYKARDLNGIILMENDLTGWNFASQNLAGAFFWFATLTNADFTDALVLCHT